MLKFLHQHLTVELIVTYKGKKIRIISVEDLIVDRLCACIFWNSPADCEQAKMLVKAYRDKLDINYLKNRAEKEDVLLQLTVLLER